MLEKVPDSGPLPYREPLDGRTYPKRGGGGGFSTPPIFSLGKLRSFSKEIRALLNRSAGAFVADRRLPPAGVYYN